MKNKLILLTQQKSIFMFLLVHGSGKTYTVVKRIEKELQEIENYQGIIACSFTKEASEELKKRINKKFNLDNCFIGTIDSFVKNIICTFVNRALKQCNKFNNQITIKNDIFFPEDNVKIDGNYITKSNQRYLTINELVRYFDTNQNYKRIGNQYYNEWLKKLFNNEYEISFPSYFFVSYIVKMDIFKEWFNNKYTTIYIDEAQDLNYFQHYFFKTLKDNTNINIAMIGDANQSIYRFRGAKPELFKQLVEDGYKEYEIDVSVRCHPSILYYAKKIFDKDLKKMYESEDKVKMINNLDIEFLKKLSKNTFILVETNDVAEELYELYKENFDIKYTKKLDKKNFDKNRYNDYYLNSDIIDELLKYYLNYDNILDRYKYPFENIENILLNCNPKVKQKDFKIESNTKLTEFLERSCNILGINISIETIYAIENKLMDDKYKYNYYIVEKNNRIMTIHNSKGLESDNVVIVLNNPYNKINDDFKNKLFVAITRARDNVYILSKNNNEVFEFINNLLL